MHEFDKIQAGAEKAGKKIANKFNLGYAGVFATAAMTSVRAIQQAISQGVEGLKTSSVLGIDVEDFAQIKRLSEETGVSMENIANTLKRGGVHADQLKRALEDAKDVTRGGFDRETSGWLAALSRTGTKAWNGVKGFLGNATASMASGISHMVGGGSWGEEAAGEIEAQRGEAALAAKRAEQAANREKMFKEGQQWARDDLFKQAQEFYGKRRDQIMANAPDRPTADALTRVGIGNIGTSSEARNYQNSSLDLFRRIERNTADLRMMKGFDIPVN